jgi:hypothetical protein
MSSKFLKNMAAQTNPVSTNANRSKINNKLIKSLKTYSPINISASAAQTIDLKKNILQRILYQEQD